MFRNHSCLPLHRPDSSRLICVCPCREQYSVLLYGLGSKRHTLQQFRTTMLQDQLVLEVNGFFPSLTIKEVDNVTIFS
jgi:Origin recognition complex, subunit 2